MEELALRPANGNAPLSISRRDILAICFRRKRLIALTFTGIFLGGLVCALILPKEYESTTQILLKRQRLEPVVTAQPTPNGPQAVRAEITEEDLNTEVQLIRSRDLLEKVVLTCGLDKASSWSQRLFSTQTPEALRIATAIDELDRKLKVEPIKKSNLIELSYRSSSSQLSKYVLTTLSEFYMQKHTAVHREPGAADFFGNQAEEYERQIAETQARLREFSQAQGTVAAHTERDNAVQKANEFEAGLHQTNSAIDETKHRISTLLDEVAKTPSRIMTSDRNEDSQLLTQLRSQLMTMELKRTELLAKYEPTYRLVQDVDAQIAQTKQTIEAEEKAPLRQRTTDSNPTALWLNGELAKARAELSSLTARAASLARSVASYRAAALQLNSKDIQEQELTRTLKEQEQEYMLYLNKRDEARISDALDSNHIVNVAIAEAPTLPYKPMHSALLVVLLGLVLASMSSFGSACAAEYMDQSFRTPNEVEGYLSVPVLAALPEAKP